MAIFYYKIFSTYLNKLKYMLDLNCMDVLSEFM